MISTRIKRIMTVILATVLLLGIAAPSMAMMYVDMPEIAQDPYNINIDELWLTSKDVKFILDAWELTNIEREKVGKKPLTLDWELSRLCKYRAIELIVNHAHEHADGDENIWDLRDIFNWYNGNNMSENIHFNGGICNAKGSIIWFMGSKPHREAMLSQDKANKNITIMGCCPSYVVSKYYSAEDREKVKSMTNFAYLGMLDDKTRTQSAFWFADGYKPKDPYDPEKNNLPKSMRQISVVEREKKQLLVPLV